MIVKSFFLSASPVNIKNTIEKLEEEVNQFIKSTKDISVKDIRVLTYPPRSTTKEHNCNITGSIWIQYLVLYDIDPSYIRYEGSSCSHVEPISL